MHVRTAVGRVDGLIPRMLLLLTLALSASNADAQDSIRIGAPLPLSGVLAPEAAKQKRGYDLWAEVVNEAGGLRVDGQRRKVEILYLDYQSDSAKARTATETLVSQHQVQFLFAPYGSAAARDASMVAEKHQVPMIAVTASSVQAYSRGHTYLFGTFTPNATLTESITEQIKQKLPQVTRLAILARDDLFPLSIAREMAASALSRGIQTVFHEHYAIDATEYKALLRRLQASDPDWIFAAGYTTDLVQVRKQMAELGILAPVVTMIAAPAYQEFIEATGPLAEHITSAAWWHPAARYVGTDIFGSTENFVRLFRQRYRSTPDYVEASAALAGALFQIAIERANSTDGWKVRDELAKLNEPTFWGPVHFGANGQIDSLIPPVFQIQNGRPVIIFPSEIAQGVLKPMASPLGASPP